MSDSFETLDPETLNTLPEGKTVTDSVGDEWERTGDGWTCISGDYDDDNPAILSSHDLVHVWGPVLVASDA